MGVDTALKLADSLVYTATGRHLSDLQRTVLQQVWQGRKYLDIARRSGYTEGHIKDVASHLWKLLSKVSGERVTKATLKSALERQLSQWSLKPAQPEATAEALSAEPLPGTTPQSHLTATVTTPISPAANQPAGEDWPELLGRQSAIADLNTYCQQGQRLVVIQGEGGVGKTTLAQRWLHQQGFERVLELLMAKETADIIPVERVVEEWLKQDFGIEPGREFGVTLGRLKRQLQNHRVGILIDNLEPALDNHGRFVEQHQRYRELLRILSDPRSQTMTLLTSRDRLCEPGITAFHYRLPSLSLTAWCQYFQQRGITAEPASLQELHRAYGGNAKAMEILLGVVQADFDGDVTAYWQTLGQDLLNPIDLKNLVDSQVSRLQELDPDAYRIYCRLGVYRYQAVAAVPAAALFHLMADLPSDRHRRILTSLRNRSLVECRKGYYWLHPVVRADAIARLRHFPDWDQANRWAADYWTASVNRIADIDQAKQALEAYYHYVAIEDYAAAGRVLLHSRENQWQQFLPLGSTLYRMGLIQPIIDAIAAIIHHIPQENSDASELYNILGDLYWITGRIHDAITCQESAIAIAHGCRQHTPALPDHRHRHYYLTMLAVDSQLSLGLYHLDLWDLDASAQLFQAVIDQAGQTPHHRWAEKATVCLALVRSHQGLTDVATSLAQSVYHAVIQGQQTGRYAFFLELLGQTFKNLGRIAEAKELLTTATVAAEDSHYIQIRAKALSGLAQLERLQHHWDQAIELHQQAIALLAELGANCDLADAHYQLALTYQAVQSQPHQQQHFQAAMQLFQAIPAPLQVARVESASASVVSL